MENDERWKLLANKDCDSVSTYLRNVFKQLDIITNSISWAEVVLRKNSLQTKHPLKWKVRSVVLQQGYSNGGPRSESGPLDDDGRTSSASQRCILYPEVFITKFCVFGRTSKAFTPRQLCDCRSSCCSAKLQCTPELGKLRFFGSNK